MRVAATLDAEPPIFYVRDNGMGIEPKYHEKIFGLFECLDSEASEGTGIGLALVKRIVLNNSALVHSNTISSATPSSSPSRGRSRSRPRPKAGASS